MLRMLSSGINVTDSCSSHAMPDFASSSKPDFWLCPPSPSNTSFFSQIPCPNSNSSWLSLKKIVEQNKLHALLHLPKSKETKLGDSNPAGSAEQTPNLTTLQSDDNYIVSHRWHLALPQVFPSCIASQPSVFRETEYHIPCLQALLPFRLLADLPRNEAQLRATPIYFFNNKILLIQIHYCQGCASSQ